MMSVFFSCYVFPLTVPSLKCCIKEIYIGKDKDKMAEGNVSSISVDQLLDKQPPCNDRVNSHC